MTPASGFVEEAKMRTGLATERGGARRTGC